MKPPSDIQAVRILLRLGWVRLRHLSAGVTTLTWFKKKASGDQRSPTPGKRGSSSIIGIGLIGFCMIVSFGSFGMQAVGTVLISLKPADASSDIMTWDWMTACLLGGQDSLWHRINQSRTPGKPPRVLREVPGDLKFNNRVFDNHADFVCAVFAEQAERLDIPKARREEYVAVRVRHYEERGPAGFEETSRGSIYLDRWSVIFSPKEQPRYDDEPLQRRGVGLLGLFLALAVLFAGGQFGMVQKAGRTAALDDLEWTLAYPVSGRAILYAQLLRNALLDSFGWIMLLPVFFFIYISAGYGWSAVPLTLLITLAVKLMCGGLILLTQIVIPLLVRPKRAVSLMAFLSMAGMIFYFAFLFLAQAHGPQAWLRRVAEAVPDPCLWLPPLSVGLVTAGGATALLGVLITLCGGMGTGIGAVAIAGHLICRGRPKPADEDRRAAAKRPARFDGSVLSGVLRTELLLLFRNRGFLLQVILLPLVILGFNGYVLLEKWLEDPAAVSLEHVAVAAYGVGAYASIFSASSAVHTGRSSLWMLYALPRPVGATLMRKTLVQGSICLFHPLLVLIAAGCMIPFSPRLISLGTLALGCSAAMAFISGGIFTLGMDPHATERKNAIGGVYVLAQMMLMGMPIAAFYSANAWTQIGTMITMWLIGLAVWQKVDDRSATMLDPVVLPPPRASMADGLIVACLFFFIQMILTVALVAAGHEAPQALFWSFLGAGLATLLGAGLSLARRRIPDVRRLFGLCPMAQHLPLLPALGLGCISGVLAAAAGAGYLCVLKNSEMLQPLYRVAREQAMGFEQGGYFLLALVILAAPLIEEPLFRGLLFNSIARSISPGLALFGSAAIFALVHPAISAAPVFLLGLLAAWSYRRTGRLISAIFTHAIYNAAITSMQQILPPG